LLEARRSVIQNDGSGALTFTANTAAAASSKTLTLQGSSADANTVLGIITNDLGTVGLTKAGTGLWVLSGANTYTGPTTVSNGVLRVTGSLAPGSP